MECEVSIFGADNFAICYVDFRYFTHVPKKSAPSNCGEDRGTDERCHMCDSWNRFSVLVYSEARTIDDG